MSAGKRNLWIIMTLTALGLAIHVWFGNTSYSCSNVSSCSYSTSTKETKHLNAVKPYRSGSCRMKKRKPHCNSAFRTTETPSVNEKILVDQEPQAINKSSFIKKVTDLGLSGSADIRILVDEEGKYVKHKMLSGMGTDFSRAIEFSIDELIFHPARRDNHPVKYWVDMSFNGYANSR